MLKVQNPSYMYKMSFQIPAGGTIPDSYYLKPEDIIGDTQAETAMVAKGGKLDIPFTVEKGTSKMIKYVGLHFYFYWLNSYSSVSQFNLSQLFASYWIRDIGMQSEIN